MKLFLQESRKNQFFSSRIRGFWNCDLRTDLLSDSYKRVHLLFKKVKTYLRSTIGNNRQHALMLMHVNKNMLHNISLADVSKDFFFIEKAAANKHSDIFFRIVHNICKIKLKLIYFSYILPFYHSLNRFPQANDHCICTSWKWFNIDVYTRSTKTTWAEPFLIFRLSLKNPSIKKKVPKNCFDEQEKSWAYLKIFRKKPKNFKAIWVALGHSKPKIFSVDQPWWPTFFRYFGPQLVQCSYFPKKKIKSSKKSMSSLYQLKTFSKNYKPITVWLWPLTFACDFYSSL